MRCINCAESEYRKDPPTPGYRFCKIQGQFRHFNHKCDYSEAKRRELHIKPREGSTWVATKLFWDVVSGRVK